MFSLCISAHEPEIQPPPPVEPPMLIAPAPELPLAPVDPLPELIVDPLPELVIEPEISVDPMPEPEISVDPMPGNAILRYVKIS